MAALLGSSESSLIDGSSNIRNSSSAAALKPLLTLGSDYGWVKRWCSSICLSRTASPFERALCRGVQLAILEPYAQRLLQFHASSSSTPPPPLSRLRSITASDAALMSALRTIASDPHSVCAFVQQLGAPRVRLAIWTSIVRGGTLTTLAAQLTATCAFAHSLPPLSKCIDLLPRRIWRAAARCRAAVRALLGQHSANRSVESDDTNVNGRELTNARALFRSRLRSIIDEATARALDDDEGYTMETIAKSWAPRFESAVEELRVSLARILWSAIVERAQLAQHLDALRLSFWMGRGELFDQLIRALHESAPESNADPHRQHPRRDVDNSAVLVSYDGAWLRAVQRCGLDDVDWATRVKLIIPPTTIAVLQPDDDSVALICGARRVDRGAALMMMKKKNCNGDGGLARIAMRRRWRLEDAGIVSRVICSVERCHRDVEVALVISAALLPDHHQFNHQKAQRRHHRHDCAGDAAMTILEDVEDEDYFDDDDGAARRSWKSEDDVPRSSMVVRLLRGARRVVFEWWPREGDENSRKNDQVNDEFRHERPEHPSDSHSKSNRIIAEVALPPPFSSPWKEWKVCANPRSNCVEVLIDDRCVRVKEGERQIIAALRTIGARATLALQSTTSWTTISESEVTLRIDEWIVDECESTVPSSSASMSSAPSSSSRRMDWSDQRLSLIYEVPWPASLVIRPHDLERFDQGFNFVWACKQVHWALRRAWKAQRRAQLPIAASLLRARMQFFLDNLLFYLHVDVVEVQFDKLRERVAQCHDFDAVRQAQRECVAALSQQCFLGSRVLRRALHHVLQVCANFAQLALAESSHEDVRHSSSASSNYGVQRLTPALSAKLERDFEHESCFLYTILAKKTSHYASPHLAQLVVRINFNDFYQRRSSLLGLAPMDHPSSPTGNSANSR